MSQHVEFHPLASLEIIDTQRWYEQQRSGLGDHFLAAVRATVDQASRSPNIGARVEIANDGTVLIRKLATAGFPYAIG